MTRTIVVPSTIHTPHPWQGTSYSSSIQERRGVCRGIIVIRMGPIGRHVIHRVQHTILILHHHEVVTLSSSVYEVIHTNMRPSYYRTINSITHQYVYTQNNSGVIILGGTDGHRHRHDNKFNKEVARLPSSNISMHHYCFVVSTNTFLYTNQQQQKKEKESGKECYQFVYCSHHSTVQYIINCT